MKRHGIEPGSTSTSILISHLHGDHFGGLPFLMLEYMWESPRKRMLTIAGPRHLEQRTRALFRTMYPGINTHPLHAQTQVRRARGRTSRARGLGARRHHPHAAHQARHIARVAGRPSAASRSSFSGDTRMDRRAGGIQRGRRPVPLRMHLFREPTISISISTIRRSNAIAIASRPTG